MSRDALIAELQERVHQLYILRKQEEEQSIKLLTLLNQQHFFPLPSETGSRLEEIRSNLNNSWEIAETALAALKQEDRLFWKDVASSLSEYLKPLIQEQQNFNSLVVHLFNELTSSVTLSLDHVRLFHHTLIRYFQRIVPVVDTKFREALGLQDRNLGLFRNRIEMLLHELDKRVETLQVDAAEGIVGAPVASEAPRANQLIDQSYKYFQFEQNFRGSRESIKQRFRDYIQYFEKNSLNLPVLDLGCGRGEFLELLKEQNIVGIGVDSNPEMVLICHEQQLDVWEDDLLRFLKSQPMDSLSGIFSSQVVEHLAPDYLLQMIETSYSRLRKGGTLLLETVNVGSAFSFLQVYTRDLTHRTPLHPETLQFLLTASGFQNEKILFSSPVPTLLTLKLIREPANEQEILMNENIDKLNKLLFDYQEYAVVAIK